MTERQTIDEYAAQMRVFIKNRQEFPVDGLLKYAGKCVAWSPDGTAIVASADDIDQLIDRVITAGYDPGRCVVSYVDDQSTLGWSGDEGFFLSVDLTSAECEYRPEEWHARG